MRPILDLPRKYKLACAFALAALLAENCAHAADFEVLYSFTGGTDGGQPQSGVITDKAHNLYGTTFSGGTGSGGTVYKLAPDGTLTVLHAFIDDGSDNGFEPIGGLIADAAGNLYGTSIGDNVFKIAPGGSETVLYAFTGGNDGEYPLAALIRDKNGNFYGTTVDGGPGGCGVVFKLKPDGRESVLNAFKCGADGAYPESGLLLKSGEFYGTTHAGGDAKFGTVFKVSRQGRETALYSFTGGKDGKYPEYVTPIMDRAENLYGTASNGGASGCGTIWKLAPGGMFTLLHSFSGADGCKPEAALLADASDNLYGTTEHGGAHGWGTVFKLAPDGTETLLHSFGGKAEGGGEPICALIADKKGNLYGTTAVGGSYDAGTVFRVKE